MIYLAKYVGNVDSNSILSNSAPPLPLNRQKMTIISHFSVKMTFFPIRFFRIIPSTEYVGNVDSINILSNRALPPLYPVIGKKSQLSVISLIKWHSFR